MRAFVAFLLLSMALAGCVGGNGSGDGPEFQRSCPAWTAFSTTNEDGESIRPAAHQARLLQYWNNTSGPEGQGSWPDTDKRSHPIIPGGPGNLTLYGEYPVDFYEFTFDYFWTLDADSELRVETAEGRPLVFWNPKPGPGENEHTAVLRFPDGTNTTDIPRYRVYLSNAASEPAPSGLVLRWTHYPDQDQDRQTHSYSFTQFEVFAWFRICGEGE